VKSASRTVDAIVAETGKTPDAVIHDPAQDPASDTTGCRKSPSSGSAKRPNHALRIAGVSTFYSKFRHKPAGKHSVNVCVGTLLPRQGRGPGDRRHQVEPGHPADQDTDAQGESYDQQGRVRRVAARWRRSFQIDDAIHG